MVKKMTTSSGSSAGTPVPRIHRPRACGLRLQKRSVQIQSAQRAAAATMEPTEQAILTESCYGHGDYTVSRAIYIYVVLGKRPRNA